jgi:hypothetical protein
MVEVPTLDDVLNLPPTNESPAHLDVAIHMQIGRARPGHDPQPSSCSGHELSLTIRAMMYNSRDSSLRSPHGHYHHLHLRLTDGPNPIIAGDSDPARFDAKSGATEYTMLCRP